MFSLESEVLARHLSLFAEKSVLFFGYVRDDFAQSLKMPKMSLCLAAILTTLIHDKRSNLA